MRWRKLRNSDILMIISCIVVFCSIIPTSKLNSLLIILFGTLLFSISFYMHIKEEELNKINGDFVDIFKDPEIIKKGVKNEKENFTDI